MKQQNRKLNQDQKTRNNNLNQQKFTLPSFSFDICSSFFCEFIQFLLSLLCLLVFLQIGFKRGAESEIVVRFCVKRNPSMKSSIPAGVWWPLCCEIKDRWRLWLSSLVAVCLSEDWQFNPQYLMSTCGSIEPWTAPSSCPTGVWMSCVCVKSKWL